MSPPNCLNMMPEIIPTSSPKSYPNHYKHIRNIFLNYYIIIKSNHNRLGTKPFPRHHTILTKSSHSHHNISIRSHVCSRWQVVGDREATARPGDREAQTRRQVEKQFSCWEILTCPRPHLRQRQLLQFPRWPNLCPWPLRLLPLWRTGRRCSQTAS